MSYTPNSHYSMFLDYFGQTHTFQTFDDKIRNKKLIKQLHGTIEEHFDELAELNSKGAGVYFTVNKTDLCGRSRKNITDVRAVFIDLDGTPLPTKFDVIPNIVVNTSRNKFHCYWIVKDMPLESFELYQEALATRFNSDPKVKDLPRVMRVAGFYHHKKNPYPVKIIQCTAHEPYTMKEIRDGLRLVRPERKVIKHDPSIYQGQYTGTLRYGCGEGDRHEQLVKMLISIRLRGETYDYAKTEALQFNSHCKPPDDEKEVLFQLNDIWKRYEPTTRIPKTSN